MIALQIAVYVLMDLTIVHTSASGDFRASHLIAMYRRAYFQDFSKLHNQ